MRRARGSTVDDLALDWSPLALLTKQARIERLTAARVAVSRLPASQGSTSGGSSFSLPVRVDLQSVEVARIELAPAVAGMAAALGLSGTATLDSLQQGKADITLRRLDGPGDYHLSGHVDAGSIEAVLQAHEPAQGLASGLAALPDLGPLSLDLDAKGPWNAVGLELRLGAGDLAANATGRVDVPGRSATLDLEASAPAMRPRPDLSWQSVDLAAHVAGPFDKPAATGTLKIVGLEAAGAGIRDIAADLSGDAAGHMTVDAALTGLRIPGSQPDLLAAAPVRIKADVQLNAADRPVRLTVSHPLLGIDGTLHAGDAPNADLDLTLPDLSGFGADLKGHGALHATAAMSGGTTTLGLTGKVSVTGGMAPAPALIGDDAEIAAEASLTGSDITLRRLHVGAAKLTADASGGLVGGVVDARAAVALSDLAAVVPTLRGNLRADTRVTGRTDALAADTTLSGDLATQGFPAAPLTATLHAEGLPNAPSGRITAQATLEGAALTLAAAAQRLADGTLHLTIDRADWKSAHAEGDVTLPPGAEVPRAHLVARMQRLDELRPLTGIDLTGGFSLTADIDDQQRAKLQMEAHNIAGADSIRLRGDGRADAMALQLDVGGMGATVTSAGMLNFPDRRLTLSRLQAGWKGETLSLLSPAQLAFADGLTVDRLRLGLHGGVLEIAGRASPTLDLTASLRNLPADLANAAAPGLGATGTLSADARLTGTAARPSGNIKLTGSGLRLTQGPAASLPAATVTASLALSGGSGQLDARANLGSSQLTVAGTVPLDPAGAANLRARGNVDLTLLDPLLTVNGRRARGQLALDAGITGRLSAPAVTGTARLSNGEVQDLAQGVRIHDINALLRATGDTIRLEQFTSRAGAGSITAGGSISLAAPMPVDLRITARNASPLASEQLTVVLDADLTLRGALAGALAVAGRVNIQRADIRVPERLPTSVAVLNVRRPGEKPPPPPAPGPDIGLDLDIQAPSRIFIRGRGIDAEMAGSLHIRGTAAAPRPEGSLTLRRGQISVVGTTLTFTSGTVGLDGSGRIDPTLNFKATSTSGGVVATLTVTGTASAPKLGLSSVPDLPQDEVLAHLLFGTSIAKLSPLQIAQIAAGLAELAGGSGGGFQPLESIRKGLGLDRLSVGAGQNGSTGALEAGRYIAPGVYLGARQCAVRQRHPGDGADRPLQGPQAGNRCRDIVELQRNRIERQRQQRRADLPVRLLALRCPVASSPLRIALPCRRNEGSDR